MPIRVLLDTSILLTSLKLRLDILGETEELLQAKVEFLVPKQVQNELRRLSAKPKLVGVRAARALEITAKCKIIDLAPAPSADDAFIRASKEIKGVVATTDSQLKRKLRAIHVPVLSLRGNRLYCEPETPQYWPSML